MVWMRSEVSLVVTVWEGKKLIKLLPFSCHRAGLKRSVFLFSFVKILNPELEFPLSPVYMTCLNYHMALAGW